MQIAVFSDIHGNYIAFQKCLDYALSRNIDTFIFLGDYLGEFPYPQKTMKMLYSMRDKYTCYFVKGNKEDYWLDRKYNHNCIWKDGNHTVGAMHYTYENQTPKDLAFYEKLTPTLEINIDGTLPILACHGSPNRNTDRCCLTMKIQKKSWLNPPIATFFAGIHICNMLSSTTTKLH